MADKEYIEREALADFLKDEIQQCEGCLAESNGEDDRYEQAVESRMLGLVDAWRKVTNTHAADVVEVRRGEWIYHECVSSYDGAISGYSCSCCCAFIEEDVYENTSFPNNFCPNCGADMRGERIESYRMQI